MKTATCKPSTQPSDRATEREAARERYVTYWRDYLTDAMEYGEAFVREKWRFVCEEVGAEMQQAVIDELPAPVWIAIEGGAIGRPAAEPKVEKTAAKFISTWQPPFIDPELEGQIVQSSGIRYRIERRSCELSPGGHRLMFCPIFEEQGG